MREIESNKHHWIQDIYGWRYLENKIVSSCYVIPNTAVFGPTNFIETTIASMRMTVLPHNFIYLFIFC